MLCAQVQFEGATGTVAFDSYGRRRNYRLDVLEHRLDNEVFKVPLSNVQPAKNVIMFKNPQAYETPSVSL